MNSIKLEKLWRKRTRRVTLRNFSKKRNEYWVDVSILPLPDKMEISPLCYQRDITDYKKLEQDLQVLCRTDP